MSGSSGRFGTSPGNMALASGSSVGTPSWPAEQVNGFLLTDPPGSPPVAGSAGRATSGLTFADDLVPQIEKLRDEVQRDVGASALERFVHGGAPAVSALALETRETFTGILRTTELYESIGTVLLRRFTPQIAAIYFEGTDAVGHLFAEYQPPRLPWVSELDVARYGATWDRYYESVDAIIGELVAPLDPAQTTVMIVSDHQLSTGARRPRAPVSSAYGNQAPLAHRGDGIGRAFGGAEFERAPRFHELGCMTSCRRFADSPDFRLAETLRGRPIDAALTAEMLAQPIVTTPDYETGAARVSRAIPADVDSDETMAKLKALGYVGGGADSKPTAGTTGQAAIPLNRYNASLVLLNEGKRNEALQIYAELQRDHPGFALGWLGEGLVRIQENKGALAIAPLERAASLMPKMSAPHAYLGDAYLQAGRMAEAETFAGAVARSRSRPRDERRYFWRKSTCESGACKMPGGSSTRRGVSPDWKAAPCKG